MKRVLVALAVGCLVATGCSTGDDAVARGGSFEFVSPGGKTEIFYDPPSDRGTIGNMQGSSVLDENETITLDDFAGQVVVINIWGSWCGPCRSEADDLQRVQAETGPQGVTVLGINVRDDRDAAADFVRNRGLTYPSIFDPPGRSLFALKGVPRAVVPATIVLDRRHRVAGVFLRELLAEDLLPVVQRLAAEPAQP